MTKTLVRVAERAAHHQFNRDASYSSADIGQWSMRPGYDGLLSQNGHGMLLGGTASFHIKW